MNTETEVESVTHMAPLPEDGVTYCCGKIPFELPRSDRMTLDPTKVTCDGWDTF